MAPRKTVMNKATKAINDMLLKKGYEANDLDIDVVVSIDGTDYIVREKSGVKFFDVERDDDKELVAEAYEDKDSGSEADTEEKKVVSKSDDEVIIAEAKPKKTGGAKKARKTKEKEIVEKEPLEDKPQEGKDENDPKEEPLEKESEAENDPQEEKAKKPRKSKKQATTEEGSGDDDKGKRRKRDPSKPRRHREKTCHNVFISEKMFELQKTMPELSGRERFTEANKLWSALSIEEKNALKKEFIANRAVPVA